MEAKEILKDLVRFDTCYDKENTEIMDYIQRLLERKNFKVEYRSKCLIMSNKEECSLAFIGHTDTVQGGIDWSKSPLEPIEVDGKIYGLGACDMKGGIAGILKAVLDTDWKQKDKGIKLVFTYDEEIGFGGINEVINKKFKLPDNVIIGEPTNNEVMQGSKGLLELKFNFEGKSAHSSNPAKGINAIVEGTKFIEYLNKFYQTLITEKDERFEIPYTTMNIGKIEGGKSINIVPNNCSIYIDFRCISNTQRTRILDEIEIMKDKYNYTYEVINDIKPFVAEGEKIKTTNFITEASFINLNNRYILGVGPVNPHEANEYITLESLDKLVMQYKELINKYC